MTDRHVRICNPSQPPDRPSQPQGRPSRSQGYPSQPNGVEVGPNPVQVSLKAVQVSPKGMQVSPNASHVGLEPVHICLKPVQVGPMLAKSVSTPPMQSPRLSMSAPNAAPVNWNPRPCESVTKPFKSLDQSPLRLLSFGYDFGVIPFTDSGRCCTAMMF